MSKTGILTYHKANNLGAVLQAYALQKTLNENLNQNAEIIDYDNGNFSEYGKNIIKNVYYFIKSKGFNNFRKNKLILSKKYNKGNIIDANKEYSSIITGSDQVWNLSCSKNDYNYFLEFVNDNVKRIAYAASVGNYKYNLEELKSIEKELRKFYKISIREQDSLKIFKNMNLDISITPDPVFLLKKEEWMKIVPKRLYKKKYIFVYLIQEDVNVMKAAEQYAKENNCEIISNKKNIKFILNNSPEKFLSWIYYADAIFTNSFHGTAFSLIFEKKLGADICLKNGKINNRIENILKSTSNEKCIIEGKNIYCIAISDNISKIRENGINFLKSCFLQKEKVEKNEHYFVGISKDNSIVKNSSSGGAFTAITDYICEKNENTKIYGCVFNEKMEVVHIRSNSLKDRDKMRGSKYVSSDLMNTFNNISEDLNKNFKVVFSGTPCQVAGLKKYLSLKKIKQENLITIDFLCHGVGSNKFFEDYVNKMEKRYKGKAIEIKFRGKSKPGKLQDMYIRFDNGKKYIAPTTKYDWFYSIYLKNLILRPSCYNCAYAGKNRVSDITLADDWSKNRDLTKSNSLILANTPTGNDIISSLRDKMFLKEVNEDDINQPNISHATNKPSNYDEFWKIYLDEGYDEAQKYIGNNTLKAKVNVIIANIVNKLNFDVAYKKIKGVLKSNGR